jgi:hypothetical protein
MPTGTKESSGQNSRDGVPPLLLLVFSGASDVELLHHTDQNYYAKIDNGRRSGGYSEAFVTEQCSSFHGIITTKCHIQYNLFF